MPSGEHSGQARKPGGLSLHAAAINRSFMPVVTKHMAQRLLVFAGLFLLVGALYLVYRELHGFRYADVAHYFKQLPLARVMAAVLLTALNYFVLTGYDVLAVRYAGRRLSYRKTALASFIGYSFSIALGHAYLTGGAVRYRLYSSWGFSATEVAKIILFCGMAFWVGYATLGGITFLVAPFTVPSSLHLPLPLRALGLLLVLLVGAYFLLSATSKRTFHFRDWQIEVPSPRLALGQAAIASIDMMIAAGVLYVLLPSTPELSYLHLLSIYLLAIIAGTLSQVPGGLGVFDGVLLLLLTPPVDPASALGGILAYRGIYYLLPLIIAASGLALTEVLRHRENVGRWAYGTTQWLPRIMPGFLAVLTFVAGAVLVWSGAVPAEQGRVRWLAALLPLALVEVSHFLGSLIGVGLLFLSRGIGQRVDAAYPVTVAALVAGIAFSLLKGADYEEALFLLVLLMLFLPCRRFFYRRSPLLARPFSPQYVAAIFAVLASAVWLGLFAFKHVEYADDLWWRFAFDADAPRLLRGLVGAASLVLALSLVWLFRPPAPKGELPGPAELEQAKHIIATVPSSEANLALLGDKRLLFSEEGNAFIMYAVQGRSWIAMGDPVGPESEQEELMWAFRTLSDRYGGRPVFYEVSPAHLPLYLDLGLALFKLGEEARVPLETFSLEGGARKGLRHMIRKLEKEGCTFEVVPPANTPALLSDLRAISAAWLAEKNTREKGFSLGYFDEDYLKHFPIATVGQDGRIVAFANVWTTGSKQEFSIDLMRYRSDAPGGVMDYLFTQLMLWGQAQGYHYFSLGMAPFSGMQTRALAPLWIRLGALLFRHGEHFYHFQGLRQYKQKFNPEWEPRFLAAPGGLALPGVLKDVAALISGGLVGAIRK